MKLAGRRTPGSARSSATGRDELRPSPVTDAAGGASLSVRVIPRAGRSAPDGVRGEALLVRLAAAPVSESGGRDVPSAYG